MNARNYFAAILGGCIAVVAASAGAQTSAAGSAKAASHEAAAPATQAAHHAKKNHATHANLKQEASNVGSQETAYRTALRRCVEGQVQQRESCLDEAISHFGRS